MSECGTRPPVHWASHGQEAEITSTDPLSRSAGYGIQEILRYCGCLHNVRSQVGVMVACFASRLAGAASEARSAVA